MIECKNLCKIYKSSNFQDVNANNNISFSFPDCGLVFITGKSGSGKTTLLNILGGLDKKTSGEYIINGKSIDDYKTLDEFRNECVGFIFQDYNLIETMSVYQNLDLVLSLQNNSKKEVICEILEKVGLKNYETKKINQLSGGQKQRVAIARALIKNSKVILADEPTGNLDSETGNEIFKLLQDISKNKLVIVVSHDEANANKFADRIINLSDGKIVSDIILNKDISLSKKAENDNETKQIKTQKHKLYFSYKFKMGSSNLFRHIGKLVISVLLMVLTLLSVCFSFLFITFNSEKSLVQTYKDDYEKVYLAQSIYSSQEDYIVEYNDYSSINDCVYDEEIFQNNNYIRGYNLELNFFQKILYYKVKRRS